MADDLRQEDEGPSRYSEDETAQMFQTVGDQVEGLDLGRDGEVNGDEGPKVVEEIESLCMNCGENVRLDIIALPLSLTDCRLPQGLTRLLLTRIPYFREIILMSFYCDNCHFKNTEIQSAGEIQERGAKHTLKLDNLDDAERQVVKSDTAILRIEDLDIEVPPGRGKLTNVEGILQEVLKDLEDGQKQRERDDPELFRKIDAIVQPLLKMMLGTRYPYTITLNDPAGNSWIEPSPEDSSNKYVCKEYPRTPQQNAELGLGGDQQSEQAAETQTDASKPVAVPQIQTGEDEGGGMEDVDIMDGTMYTLPCTCPGCGKPAYMNLQMVKIPYFKEVVVDAVVCPACGYKTSDVKTGGEIPKKGQRIWLEVRDPTDLRRDILKSETCLLKIPECKVDVVPGTMGGRFTTVEGLLTQMRDDLHSSIFDMDDEGSGGDSMPQEKKKAWDAFFTQLNKAIKAEIQYTVIMEDPLSSSYVQSLNAPDPDPQIRTEEYNRTAEEEEELGLADLKTERQADGEYVRAIIPKSNKEQTGENGLAQVQAESVDKIRHAEEEAQKRAAQIAAEEEEEP